MPSRRLRPLGLRSQVRRAIALVAVLALLLFGVPLSIALSRLIESQALTGLQRDATRAVAVVPDNTLEADKLHTVPKGTGDTRLGVYDAAGMRVAGVGPTHSPLAGQVTDGKEHDGHDLGDLAVAVPVLSDTTVVGSVRAALPLSVLHRRAYEAWTLLLALGAVVVGLAVLLARRAARRISDPFEHLTEAAKELGAGRYDLTLAPSGMPEADAAGQALQDSARQIDELLRHEREFVRDASHQLRTPLSAVQLFLEQDPPDVPAALERTRHLETTIADLIALRRLPHGTCDPTAVAAEAVARWNSPQKPVTLRADAGRPVAMSAAALRQSLDVLLDNALRHGRAPVTVTVEPSGDAVVLEVADHGDGFAAQSQHGTGLQLVTGIVERAGGSLLIRRRAPSARVALLVPVETEVANPDQSSSKR